MPASWLPRIAMLIALALLGSSAPAMGQAQTLASRPSHAAQLKNALRSVAAAQARHHAAKQTFAATADALRLPPAPGVRVEILAAGRSG